MGEIRTNAAWTKWVQGLGQMDKVMRDHTKATFQAAVERFYDHTQDRVHVDTGALKASGDVWVEEESRDEIVAYVAYGDDKVDYAFYEHARGGSHAFLRNGWQATEREFADALPEAWKRVMRSWS
jgi:hypothetical protein